MNYQANGCNQGKHFFINGDFCDKCDIDFDEWYVKLIEHTRKETSLSLLSALDSIIRQQVIARQLTMATGDYILDAVKDQCRRKRWTDQ